MAEQEWKGRYKPVCYKHISQVLFVILYPSLLFVFVCLFVMYSLHIVHEINAYRRIVKLRSHIGEIVCQCLFSEKTEHMLMKFDVNGFFKKKV
jgi:hypothetical protein